jgi:preprotein translocase subunit SecG
MLVTILTVLFVLICPLIIAIVLMQDPKGGGLAGALGGAGGGSAFGAKTADVVMKTTVTLGIVFFLLSIALGLTLKKPLSESIVNLEDGAPVAAGTTDATGEGVVDESATTAPEETSDAAAEASGEVSGDAVEAPATEAAEEAAPPSEAVPAAPAESGAPGE